MAAASGSSGRLTSEEMFAAVMRHGTLECTKVEGGKYPVDVEGALSTMTAEPRWAQYPTMQMIHGADAVRSMYAQLDGNAFFDVKRWWADEERQDLIAEMRVGKVLPDGSREEWDHVVLFEFEGGLIKTEIGYHSIDLKGM
jgi:SnoaL-like domain